MKKTNIFKAVLGGLGALAGIGAIVSAFKKEQPEEEVVLDDEIEEVSEEE